MKKLLLSLLIGAALSANAQQGYKDGIEYFKAGQYENAKTILERTLNDASTDKSIAYYYLGQTELAYDNKAAARTDFDKGILADPNCPYNYVGLGAIDLLNGQLSTAQDNFKKAEKLDSKNYEILVSIARAYYDADPVQYDKYVQEYLTKAHKKSKDKEPSIYILEGDISYRNKDYGDAAGKYEMATNFDEGNPEGYVKYANAYFFVNKAFAIKKLEELLSKRPNSALAQRELAEKYYESDQWSKAAQQYGEYIKNPNHFPEDKERYAVLLYASDQNQKSIDIINELIADNGSNFLLERLLMLNYAALKDYPAARQHAENFFSKNAGKSFQPNDYNTYADVLENLGEDSLAIVQMQKSLELTPDNSGLIKNISSKYSAMRDYPKAAEYYQKYVESLKEPSATDYYMLSGRWLNAAATSDDEAIKTNAIEKGLAAINYAIENSDPDPDVLNRKARLLFVQNGNQPNEEVAKLFEDMIVLLDKDPENLNPNNENNYRSEYKFAIICMGNYYQKVNNKEKVAQLQERLKEFN